MEQKNRTITHDAQCITIFMRQKMINWTAVQSLNFGCTISLLSFPWFMSERNADISPDEKWIYFFNWKNGTNAESKSKKVLNGSVNYGASLKMKSPEPHIYPFPMSPHPARTYTSQQENKWHKWLMSAWYYWHLYSYHCRANEFAMLYRMTIRLVNGHFKHGHSEFRNRFKISHPDVMIHAYCRAFVWCGQRFSWLACQLYLPLSLGSNYLLLIPKIRCWAHRTNILSTPDITYWWSRYRLNGKLSKKCEFGHYAFSAPEIMARDSIWIWWLQCTALFNCLKNW